MPEERKLLEPGMILLDPNDGQPKVWTVKSTGPRQATVVAHWGTVGAVARLKTNRLPDGWALVDSVALGKLLAYRLEADPGVRL